MNSFYFLIQSLIKNEEMNKKRMLKHYPNNTSILICYKLYILIFQPIFSYEKITLKPLSLARINERFDLKILMIIVFSKVAINIKYGRQDHDGQIKK